MTNSFATFGETGPKAKEVSVRLVSPVATAWSMAGLAPVPPLFRLAAAYVPGTLPAALLGVLQGISLGAKAPGKLCAKPHKFSIANPENEYTLCRPARENTDPGRKSTDRKSVV